MIRSQKFWIAVCIAVFVGSLIWAAAAHFTSSSGSTVRIVRDGEVLYTLDLDKEPDREITVEYEGRKNVIDIKDGSIRMLSADCPDKCCIEQGAMNKERMFPIICLPNRIVIEPADSELDAVAR